MPFNQSPLPSLKILDKTLYCTVCPLTSFLYVLGHSFHAAPLRDLVNTDRLGVWEWTQDARQQPHPLIPIPTG